MVNYSRIIGEAPIRMINPSVMVSRLDLVVLERTGAGIVFRRLPQGFWNIWRFIGRRGGAGGHRGGHNPMCAPGPPGRPGGLCPPQSSPLILLWPTNCLLVQKISPNGSAAFGIRLVLIFCEVKKQVKTTTSTRHYVNRQVPKNNIKFL